MQPKFLSSYLRSLLLVLIILYLSFANAKQFEGGPSFVGIDKLVHFVLYALLSASLFVDTHKSSIKITLQQTFWLSFVGSFVLGGGVEIAQGLFFETRSGDWADFAFDFFGALIASYLIFYYARKKRLMND